MAYRRPGVTVTQEFVGLVPALAQFALPCLAVGAAYQLVDEDALGTYSGSQQAYAYASLMGGAAVDLEELADDELFPITKKPISARLLNTIIEILPSTATGAGVGQAFSDSTTDVFENVLVGDLVDVIPALAVEIVSAQTDGSTVATAGLRNRLTDTTPANLFANVKIGDSVIVTAGTNTNTGTFIVTAKISNSVIVVDNDINDGVGVSSDVAYSITGDRGVANEGTYRIKTKTDNNNLVLESPLVEDEAPITYRVRREHGEVVLDRVATLVDPGFVASEDAITLPAGLQVTIETVDYDILSADVEASYRALRSDLAANVREFSRLSDLQAFFGVDQIGPANPLAYGLQFMLQNTVTAVNGLGLDANAVSNETLSFQNALDVLTLTQMYALVPLTQSPVIHQLFKTHVEGLSEPDKKLERVAIINSQLNLVEELQDESTTVTTLSGARTVVSTQVDGENDGLALAKLADATADAFLNVQLGDTVTIVSGTNVTPGTYVVTVKDSNNLITLGSAFATGVSTDIVYFIQRQDGLGADGLTFYDRNASFISDGIAAGHYVRVTAGALAGRYAIAAVVSEKQLTLAEAVLGVVSLQTAITYLIDRDLSKTEQATAVAGYSSSIGSRRVVHTWPDIVKAPVGPETEDLPGFYVGCAIGALTTGLPTQQGFTNLSISGFLGFEHSTGYFTEEQLDTIAGGGTLVMAQDGEDQPLYVRHQLTTDLSAIKFQEYSVTKNVDFIAKFLRDNFASFIGSYNIVDTTLDELKTNAKAQIEFLRDTTRRARIGGVIRSGSLVLLEESETQIDTVLMRFKFNIPIPLNNLDITIEV